MNERLPADSFDQSILNREINPDRLREIGGAAFVAGDKVLKQIECNFTNFSYHNIDHTEAIEVSATTFVQGFMEPYGYSQEQKILTAQATKFSAQIHDAIVIATKAKENSDSIGSFTARNRGWRNESEPWSGGNEYQSFLLGVRYVLEELIDDLPTNASDQEVYEVHNDLKKADPTYRYFMDEVEDGVRVTVPAVVVDTFPEGTTLDFGDVDARDYLFHANGQYSGLRIYQPHLLNPKGEPPQSLTGLSMATADIKACGYVDDAERFFAIGDKEMLESKYQIAINLDRALRGELTDSEAFDELLNEIDGWIQSQVGFVLWQKLDHEKVKKQHPALAQNPDRAAAFDEKLSYFDSHIVAAARRADEFARLKDGLLESEGSVQDKAERVLAFLQLGDKPDEVVAKARAYAESLPAAA